MTDPVDFRSVLASVDQQGRRRWLDVLIRWGRWRRLRAALAVPLIAFYLIVPFVMIDGRPFLRFDLPERRFYLLGQVFWPQDFSYFLLIVLIGLVGTLLTVALLGRVFCGWFCPHNVFLEMVFRPIERLISPRRQGLRAVALWLVFAVIAGALANAGTAIFVGPEAFRHGLFLDPIGHPAAAMVWAVFFVVILFNFGWFREQTCTIVCPYGRFQSAMLDQHTLVVAYDAQRGEPRGHIASAAGASTTTGDCIDCHLCVRVCPTGIDIRNGNQLECLHCTACIDACDHIMAKTGRKPGLVRFASEAGLAGERRRVLRPRTVLYSVVVTTLCAVLVWQVATRPDVLASSLRPQVLPVFELDPHGRDSVRALLPLALVNRTDRDLTVRLAMPAELDAHLIVPGDRLILPPNTRREVTAIAYLPRSRMPARHLDTRLDVLADDRLVGSTPIAIPHP